MHVVGKSSWIDRQVGNFYVGKKFPSSRFYIEDRGVGNFFKPKFSVDFQKSFSGTAMNFR